MKILVIKNTVAGGRPVEVGDVIDVSDHDARFLIAIGKAVKAIDQPASIEAAVAPPAAMPDVEVAVAPPAKRGRPRKAKK